MTWIKTILRKDWDEALRNAMTWRTRMPKEYGTTRIPSLEVLASQENGGGIVESHTLLPETLLHAFSTHTSLMNDALPLNRAQHEMIATVVSVANHCFY